MSNLLLKKLIDDSETYSQKFKSTGEKSTGAPKTGMDPKSKKVKKKERSVSEIQKKSSKILGDTFKSTLKKMKVSTNKNLILEKNLDHFTKMQKKGKVAESVVSHLVEKLSKKR